MTEEDKVLFENIKSLAGTLNNKDETFAAVNGMQNEAREKCFLQKYNEFV